MSRFFLSWSALLFLSVLAPLSAYAQDQGLPVLSEEAAPNTATPNVPSSNVPSRSAPNSIENTNRVRPLEASPVTEEAIPSQAVPLQAVPSQALPSQTRPATSLPVDASYLLGPGDELSLSFFNVPEYDGQRQVAIDGSLNLPLIGKIPVAGLTVEGGTQAISNAYASYLKTPLVTVDLLRPRPIQIGLSGEVNKPGSYEVQLSDSEDTSLQWPTIVEAIQLAGGITNQADIRDVEIQRAQPGGGRQTLRLNLWEILATGSIQNDITLRHGDAISIPVATSLTPGELTQLSAANFSPEAIRVTVVGEVPQPGALEIVPNAPLNQALLAAGGFDPQRADTGEVDLVRLNPDGTVSQRTIAVSFDQGINDETNPALQNNDVILVGRSGRAVFSDNVEGALGPVGTILSPFGFLLNLFN